MDYSVLHFREQTLIIPHYTAPVLNFLPDIDWQQLNSTEWALDMIQNHFLWKNPTIIAVDGPIKLEFMRSEE
jgi:hypothetical protein